MPGERKLPGALKRKEKPLAACVFRTVDDVDLDDDGDDTACSLQVGGKEQPGRYDSSQFCYMSFLIFLYSPTQAYANNTES